MLLFCYYAALTVCWGERLIGEGEIVLLRGVPNLSYRTFTIVNKITNKYILI